MAQRPLRRSSQWDQWGLRPDRGVISLLVVLTLIYLVFKLGPAPIQQFFVEHLMLRPRLGLGVEPWQLVTSGFVEGGLRAVFATAITLIFFGNVVEQMLGARGLWKLFIAGTVGGGLFMALLGRLLAPDVQLFGAQSAGTAILVAYAVLMSGRDVMAFGVARMRGGTIAWIWIGIAVISCLADALDGNGLRAALEIAGLTGAGLAGWLVVGRGGVGLGGLRGSFDRMRLWRLRRRYRVLSGGRDDKRYLN
jgi:membrane associated rhomboid family serine protease